MKEIKEYLKIAKIEFYVEQTLTENICISTNQIIKAPMLQMLINLANAKQKVFRIQNNQLIIY